MLAERLKVERFELLHTIFAEWLNVKLAGSAAFLMTGRLALIINVELAGTAASVFFDWLSIEHTRTTTFRFFGRFIVVLARATFMFLSRFIIKLA